MPRHVVVASWLPGCLGGWMVIGVLCPHACIALPHPLSFCCMRSHDWAEAWADGRWHFLDPDGSKKLDDGWFKANTQMQTVHEGDYLNHSIVASSFASTFTLPSGLYPDSLPISHFPMVWDWQNDGVGGWDVTERYLQQ